MPNVESQLRQYFDSTVERIDVDDVLAGARVSTQLQRWDIRARHQLLAFTAAAFGVAASISLVVVGVLMLSGGQRIGEATVPTAATPATPIAWPLGIFGVGAAIAATTALTITRKRKGGVMDTMERQEPEVQIKHLQKSNRGLIVALVVALLALAGLGGWMLFDTIDTGAAGEINALLDEYIGLAETSDWEAAAELFTASGVFIDDGGDITRKADYVAYYENVEQNVGKFAVESLGDRSIIEDPERNRYFVAAQMQIGFGVDPIFKGFSTFVLTEMTDGSFKIISHQFTPHENHR